MRARLSASFGPIRLILLLALGAILLLRVGPFCEMVAQAAPPAAASAAHCHEQPSRPMPEKAPGKACVAGGCIALPADVGSFGDLPATGKPAAWLIADTGLDSLSSEPTPPPSANHADMISA